VQRPHELRGIDPVLAAGILDRVKASDRAAHAQHAVVEKGANGGRPAPHHIIDESVGRNRHRDLQVSPAL